MHLVIQTIILETGRNFVLPLLKPSAQKGLK